MKRPLTSAFRMKGMSFKEGQTPKKNINKEAFKAAPPGSTKEELLEIKINEDEFQFSARLEIDYLNDKYQLDLPESDEYETIAGLIINVHESIPEKGEIIRLNQFVFTVEQVHNNRIESIKIKRINPTD